jgi:hypothetical protein
MKWSWELGIGIYDGKKEAQVLKREIMQGPFAKKQCAGYLYVELFTPPPARAVTN